MAAGRPGGRPAGYRTCVQATERAAGPRCWPAASRPWPASIRF